MTRHSKNNTANPVFTYGERKKVKDFNSLKQRLGVDSMRKFEQCWLCLSTAVKPVATPLGYIYCRECIVLCLSKQMEDKKKRLRDWKNRVEMWKLQANRKKELEHTELERKLIEDNLYGATSIKKGKSQAIKGETGNIFKTNENAEATKNNFWLSSATNPKSQRNANNLVAPDCVMPPKPKCGLKCPITGKPLRVKDLLDINPETTRRSDDDPNSDTIWLCSISKKPISHHNACIVKSTGKIVLTKYVNTCELDQEQNNLFIPLIPGGTGFAAHNNVEAKKFRPALQ